MDKTEVLGKLRDISGVLQRLSKEITSTNVPGLSLVREDLGVRTPKKRKRKDVAYGQKHKEPIVRNKITLPGKTVSDVPNLGPNFPEWAA